MAVVDIGAFPPATAVVDCDGLRHRLRWEAGEVVAPDHGDPEGERALAVLGGKKLTCIEVLNAWAAHCRDPRVLSVLTRGPGDPLLLGAQQANVGAHAQGPSGRRVTSTWPMVPAGRGSGWVGYAPLAQARPGAAHMRALAMAQARAARRRGVGGFTLRAAPLLSPGHGARAAQPDVAAEGLEVLAQLDGDIPMRLVATVTAHLLNSLASEGPAAGQAVPALEVSLIARGTNALSTWQGRPLPDLQVEVAEAGAQPVLEDSDGGSLRASLALSWVADVWGRGLAVVGGRFAIALLEGSPGRVVLETVAGDLRAPRPMTIELR
jgi:hypothetical protein